MTGATYITASKNTSAERFMRKCVCGGGSSSDVGAFAFTYKLYSFFFLSLLV